MKTHSNSFSLAKRFNADSVSVETSSCDTPLRKFEPLSDLISEIGPLIDMNRRRAQIRELASIDSRTSTCIDLLARHVMSKNHRFESAVPPRVLLVINL